MQRLTYVEDCLKEGRIVRWQNSSMPLKFFIGPFTWYKANENDSYRYKGFVMEALNLWTKASNNAVRFQIVNSLQESQINLEWKRVDRKALGYCKYNHDKFGRLYSAEVQIGLSDGLLHAKYMDEKEVMHTIIHEIGHAIGLGHSPFQQDIMYVPHQYGVVGISASDVNTIQWLYEFPCNSTVKDFSKRVGVNANNFDDLIAYIVNSTSQQPAPTEEQAQQNEFIETKDLIEEQSNIAELKKYNLLFQDVKLSQKYNHLWHPKK